MTPQLEADAPRDFDFLIGDWKIRHQRLNEKFTGCGEWTEFEGISSASKTLGGFGNIEDHQLFFPSGTFRAVAIRAYCKTSATWSIWWLDGRNPLSLDVPVHGKFEKGVGIFLTDDTLDGVPIKVKFTWLCEKDTKPRWEQAFSNDGGLSWETNWIMEFTPLA